MFRSDKNSNILGVEVKNYGECGWCLDEENKAILNLPWEVWSQWMHISQQMGGKEWGGVFWVKDNTITSFKIPKQEVTSVDCEFKEELGGDGIIHSHHNMGAFHSSQDNQHARNLYTYSIVLSNGKGYEATKRVKLSCGAFGYVKVELCLIGCPDIELSKITEKRQESILDTSSGNDRQHKLDFENEMSPCDRCVSGDCENCEFFGDAYLACNDCDSFTCKTCKFVVGRDAEAMLPFCDFCEDMESCSSCGKLAKYLNNYPEDKKQFEYLYKNKL